MRRYLGLCLGLFLTAAVQAQPVVRTVFPPQEYAARRAQLFDKIGDGIAIIEGTTERPGEQPFRQANQFAYLTGAAEPRAIALLDGRTRATYVFLLSEKTSDVTSKFGPGALYPGESAAQTLGVTAALPRDAFAAMLAKIGAERRIIYTPFAPEVLGSASPYDTALLAKLTRDDPWDGRESREQAFRAKIAKVAPNSEIRDLDPLIDQLRAIKSPREIAVLREATRIADDGIAAAIRAAQPGMTEYQLQAESEYVFKRAGAYGPAYFALVATGQNTWYTHYHYNTAILRAGDLVQYDYAPDYRGYASDVTRVFPANGHFTAHQREYYDLYVALYRAIMTSIRVHESPREIRARAVTKMDAIVAAHSFRDPALRQPFRDFVDAFRKGGDQMLGHAVGEAVHDTYGTYKTLEPGMVFTIEPMLRLPAEHVAMRLEDMIVITPQGYEILSAELPLDADAIERMMASSQEHARHGRSSASSHFVRGG